MIKLVADNTVTELPVYNFQDIASCARRFADQVEAGEQGEVLRVLCVIDTSEGIALASWGDNLNMFEAIGLLEAAKLTSYASNFEEE